MSDVTRLLGAIGQGDPPAAEELLPLVYDKIQAVSRSPASPTFDRRQGLRTPAARCLRLWIEIPSRKKWIQRWDFNDLLVRECYIAFMEMGGRIGSRT